MCLKVTQCEEDGLPYAISGCEPDMCQALNLFRLIHAYIIYHISLSPSIYIYTHANADLWLSRVRHKADFLACLGPRCPPKWSRRIYKICRDLPGFVPCSKYIECNHGFEMLYECSWNYSVRRYRTKRVKERQTRTSLQPPNAHLNYCGFHVKWLPGTTSKSVLSAHGATRERQLQHLAADRTGLIPSMLGKQKKVA